MKVNQGSKRFKCYKKGYDNKKGYNIRHKTDEAMYSVITKPTVFNARLERFSALIHYVNSTSQNSLRFSNTLYNGLKVKSFRGSHEHCQSNSLFLLTMNNGSII